MLTTTTAPDASGSRSRTCWQCPATDASKYELIGGRLRTVPTGARHGEIVSSVIVRLHAAKTPTVALYSESAGNFILYFAEIV